MSTVTSPLSTSVLSTRLRNSQLEPTVTKYRSVEASSSKRQESQSEVNVGSGSTTNNEVTDLSSSDKVKIIKIVYIFSIVLFVGLQLSL